MSHTPMPKWQVRRGQKCETKSATVDKILKAMKAKESKEQKPISKP